MEWNRREKLMCFKLRFQLQWNRRYMLYELANLNCEVKPREYILNVHVGQQSLSSSEV